MIFADTDKLNETSRNLPIRVRRNVNSRGVADTVADQREGLRENEIGGNEAVAGIEQLIVCQLANSSSAPAAIFA